MQNVRPRVFSTSWIHHYGRNKHHFEHWVDYGIDCDTVIHGVPMPRKYIAEMVMDRISASRNYHPDTYTDAAPLEYFLKSKDRLWFVHEKLTKIWKCSSGCWPKEGKKETLKYIKHVYLKGK